jgi:hypothetical protein
MRREELLHALVGALLALLKIKGRIAVRKAECLDFASRIQRISVDDHIEYFGGFLGTVGVEFDAVSPARRRMPGHCDQRPALTGAGIDHRTAGSESKSATYFLCNRIRKRKKVHPNAGMVASHGESPWKL